MQEMQKVQVPPWVGKIPLEKEMATPSSILAWELPWTEVPGGLQSRGLQRVGHDWATVHTQLISNVLLSGVQSDSVAKWFSYKYTCIYSFSNSCQKNFFLEEVRHDFYQCLFKLGFNFTSDALKILNSQSSYNNQLLKTDLSATESLFYIWKLWGLFSPTRKWIWLCNFSYHINGVKNTQIRETLWNIWKMQQDIDGRTVWNFVWNYIKFHPMDGWLQRYRFE